MLSSGFTYCQVYVQITFDSHEYQGITIFLLKKIKSLKIELNSLKTCLMDMFEKEDKSTMNHLHKCSKDKTSKLNKSFTQFIKLF